MKSIYDIIQSQHNFFYTGQTKDLDFRMSQLKALYHTIKSHEEEIIEALYKDFKKPPMESFSTEIFTVLGEIKYFIKHLPKLSKSKQVPTSIINFPSKSFVTPEPYGVCLIISPWNYPLQLALSPLIGAIAAGNCAIIKPSEYSPHTSKLLKEMLKQIYPDYYVSVIEGDQAVAQKLLNQPLDYIFFTGGTEVGKKIMLKAAENLIPVTLELGGKSPVIVDADANIEVAARRIAWGKFINCGQTCIAPDYVLVHEDVKDHLLHHLRKNIIRFYSSTPKYSPDYARIINHRHFDRLASYIQADQVFFGGQVDRDDLFISPTILHQVPLNAPVMAEEIFGPILPVVSFGHLGQAIDMVQAKPKPLALYYFGQNKKRAAYVETSLSFGGGCINDTIMHVASSDLPFGGVGYSGMGSYHGQASFNTFSHFKSILAKSPHIDVPLRYPPYKGKLKLLQRFTDL